MESCSENFMKYMTPAGEMVKMPYENGAHIDAYFLRALYELKQQSAVIYFGGLDQFKDELLHQVVQRAHARGIRALTGRS